MRCCPGERKDLKVHRAVEFRIFKWLWKEGESAKIHIRIPFKIFPIYRWCKYKPSVNWVGPPSLCCLGILHAPQTRETISLPAAACGTSEVTSQFHRICVQVSAGFGQPKIKESKGYWCIYGWWLIFSKFDTRRYYGLNMKCRPQSPTGSWGGSENLRR